MVNQVEFHPLLSQKPLHEFCKNNGILLEAWAPLMRGQNLGHPLFRKIAKKYNKTPAQIILRWDLQHGVVTIPKSSNEKRIKENFDIFNFQLEAEDMLKIDALNENKRIGPDPDNFKF
jgi:diketogulonate reductase-like aldo/keto reductase